MTDDESAARAALAASARAFERAKAKGYVWLGEQGALETYESDGAFTPPPTIYPGQLRLA